LKPAADSRPNDGQAGRQSAGDPPETDRERRIVNVVIVGFILLVIGAGLWLADALQEARRADECMSSGRRNCGPITAPRPPPRL
jgi:hypothetical protein